jgi:pimeloyl-ACP methyl ester carboxylesterase
MPIGITRPSDLVAADISLEWCNVSGKRKIAMRRRAGQGAPIVWIGGFRSDMMSTKALALDAFAARKNLPMIRFDYSAHGESPGVFETCGISDWLEDTLAVLATLWYAKPILVGSSMGGWLTLLAVRERAKLKLADPQALVLIAPAVDFTEELMWAEFTDEMKAQIMRDGVYHQPSEYGDPYPITKYLIEDGRKHLLFGSVIDPRAPVAILQGMNDDAVPYSHATKLLEHMPQADCSISFVKDGDHRLSRPEDIELLLRTVEQFTA